MSIEKSKKASNGFLNMLKKYKLTVSFLLIIILFLSFGIIIINGLFTLGNFTRDIYEHPLIVSNASLLAALNITKMHRSMKDVVLAETSDEIRTALRHVSENEHIVVQQLDVIREQIIGKEGQDLEKQTRRLLISWKPIREEVVKLLNSGEKKDAINITKFKGADHEGHLEAKMLELTSYARKKADDFFIRAERKQLRLENITIILTVLGVLLSSIIAFITTYLVAKSRKLLENEKNKLQQATDEIKVLHGIIPICSFCKQIRDDKGSWEQMEAYIDAHSEASFTHSICPNCLKENYPEFQEERE